MVTYIDNVLGRITMYRLMLYYLCALLLAAIVLGGTGLMPYNPLHIAGTALGLVLFCYVFNWFFATLFRAKQNPESKLITALILALIVGPISGFEGLAGLFLISLFAIGSKYVIAYNKRHMFNPAAAGVLLGAALFGYGASWWVGHVYMTPFILAGGLLIAYKIHRLEMVGIFMATFVLAVATIAGLAGHSSGIALRTIIGILSFAPVFFFAMVMLVEPMTSPQRKELQYGYAVLVGILAAIFGVFEFAAPYALELALLFGNIFAYLPRSSAAIALTLRAKEVVARDSMGFWFDSSRPIVFKPGQFMQWELPHRDADGRGVRRFFTLCSSPTEQRVMLTTKFSEPSSTFKTALRAMREQDQMTAFNVEGDFVLPTDDDATPCVFIAGGIGITPFRSMVKYMLDMRLSRPVTLLYSNRTADDIAFKPLFDEAVQAGWLKAVYTITDSAPYGWLGRMGYITPDVIRAEVPDHASALYYVSGPQGMVATFVEMLSKMGIPQKQIKTDYFPGYEDTYQSKS